MLFRKHKFRQFYCFVEYKIMSNLFCTIKFLWSARHIYVYIYIYIYMYDVPCTSNIDMNIYMYMYNSYNSSCDIECKQWAQPCFFWIEIQISTNKCLSVTLHAWIVGTITISGVFLFHLPNETALCFLCSKYPALGNMWKEIWFPVHEFLWICQQGVHLAIVTAIGTNISRKVSDLTFLIYKPIYASLKKWHKIIHKAIYLIYTIYHPRISTDLLMLLTHRNLVSD